MTDDQKTNEENLQEALHKAKEDDQVMTEEEQKEVAKEAEEAKATKSTKKNKKDKKDQQIEELKDKLTRQMAEFDNYRKRTDKEKSCMYEIGVKDVVEKILPVLDNFERGLDCEKKEEDLAGFAQGMDMIYKQLITVLEDIGVKPIEAVGQPFNPDLHNAVMHEDDDSMGENLVSQEFQKGYVYKDSVVRHSMVKVVN